MRTIIIDDKIAIRASLKMLLALYTPEVVLIGEADGVQTGLKCIQEHQPDLVLLDVEMEDGLGFDLLALCKEINFKVIFVTAHDAYAIKAFKYSAIDYLLKPVDPDELVKAIKKAQTQLSTHQQQLAFHTLQHNRQVKGQQHRLLLSDADHVYLVGIEEIVRCQSAGNYTQFHLTDKRSILVSKTMKEYANLLEDANFFRAHQSHLINLAHFNKYEKKDGGIVHMKDGSTLPVAIRRKERLFEVLKNQ